MYYVILERSPMYTHLATCIDGIEVIRNPCNMEEDMVKKFDIIQDGQV